MTMNLACNDEESAVFKELNEARRSDDPRQASTALRKCGEKMKKE
jgi:hypothetical protein